MSELDLEIMNRMLDRLQQEDPATWLLAPEDIEVAINGQCRHGLQVVDCKVCPVDAIFTAQLRRLAIDAGADKEHASAYAEEALRSVKVDRGMTEDRRA